MSSLRVDDLKLFISAYKKFKDQEEGALNVFSDNYRYIERSIHKGIWYFGTNQYCLFDNGTLVCKMSGSEIEQLEKLIEAAKETA